MTPELIYSCTVSESEADIWKVIFVANLFSRSNAGVQTRLSVPPSSGHSRAWNGFSIYYSDSKYFSHAGLWQNRLCCTRCWHTDCLSVLFVCQPSRYIVCCNEIKTAHILCSDVCRVAALMKNLGVGEFECDRGAVGGMEKVRENMFLPVICYRV